MFLDIRGLPTTSNKRRKNIHTTVLEDVPAFSLPEPANRSLVHAYYAVDTKTSRKDRNYSVENMEALDLAGAKNAETLKVVGNKKRGFGDTEMQGRGAEERDYMLVGALDAVPTKCMEGLKLDDKIGGGGGDGDGDVDMHTRDVESTRLGKEKRRFSACV